MIIPGLWKYRQLVWQLAVRELKARYKISVLGFFWSLLRPLLTIVVLAAVFSELGFSTPRYGISYPTFLLAAYLPWFFFSTALLEGTQSLLSNSHLIKKVYSPREVYPTAIVLAHLVNFLLALLVLLPVVYLIFRVSPSVHLMHLPVVILVHTAFLLGLCYLTSVYNALYRDTGQIMEFAVFVWFYVTPVLYDVTMVMQKWPDWGKWLYFLNPLAGIVEWYRYALYASALQTATEPHLHELMQFLFTYAIPYSTLASLMTLFLGYAVLKRNETRAVDSL